MEINTATVKPMIIGVSVFMESDFFIWELLGSVSAKMTSVKMNVPNASIPQASAGDTKSLNRH